MKIRAVKRGVGRSAGSALLVVMMLMGVLGTMALMISSLVIKEIRLNSIVLDSEKADYAGEAGVERALYLLKKADPGKSGNGSVKVGGFEFDKNFGYEFEILNIAKSWPAFKNSGAVYVEGEEKVFDEWRSGRVGVSVEKLPVRYPGLSYAKLGLNETVTIPLFVVDKSGVEKKVRNFRVEYFVNFNAKDIDSNFFVGGNSSSVSLSDINVLRWKIYGKGVDGKTYSIADFFPAVEGIGPNSPVCFGSDLSFKFGKSSSVCMTPSFSVLNDDGNGFEKNNASVISNAARECYLSDAGAAVTGGDLVKKVTSKDLSGCSIANFLNNYERNYLVLTNNISPEILGISNPKIPENAEKLLIYYRVLVDENIDDFLPYQNPLIIAKGFSRGGQIVKEILRRVGRLEILPVFGFSLVNN